MIFLAATAEERWMGSMKMLAASEPEIMENLDSDAMEKLRRRHADLELNQTKHLIAAARVASYLGDGQRR